MSFLWAPSIVLPAPSCVVFFFKPTSGKNSRITFWRAPECSLCASVSSILCWPVNFSLPWPSWMLNFIFQLSYAWIPTTTLWPQNFFFRDNKMRQLKGSLIRFFSLGWSGGDYCPVLPVVQHMKTVVSYIFSNFLLV